MMPHSKLPAAKPLALIQYWVNTGYLPYDKCDAICKKELQKSANEDNVNNHKNLKAGEVLHPMVSLERLSECEVRKYKKILKMETNGANLNPVLHLKRLPTSDIRIYKIGSGKRANVRMPPLKTIDMNIVQSSELKASKDYKSLERANSSRDEGTSSEQCMILFDKSNHKKSNNKCATSITNVSYETDVNPSVETCTWYNLRSRGKINKEEEISQNVVSKKSKRGSKYIRSNRKVKNAANLDGSLSHNLDVNVNNTEASSKRHCHSLRTRKGKRKLPAVESDDDDINKVLKQAQCAYAKLNHEQKFEAE